MYNSIKSRRLKKKKKETGVILYTYTLSAQFQNNEKLQLFSFGSSIALYNFYGFYV